MAMKLIPDEKMSLKLSSEKITISVGIQVKKYPVIFKIMFVFVFSMMQCNY